MLRTYTTIFDIPGKQLIKSNTLSWKENKNKMTDF